MSENQQLKEILKRGGALTASPNLENAIMSRIHLISAARKKGHQPLLNIRLLLGLVLTYIVISLLMLQISFMLDQGHAFDAVVIPVDFSVDSSNAASLVLSLLAFWALVFANFFYKKYSNRSFPKF